MIGAPEEALQHIDKRNPAVASRHDSELWILAAFRVVEQTHLVALDAYQRHTPTRQGVEFDAGATCEVVRLVELHVGITERESRDDVVARGWIDCADAILQPMDTCQDGVQNARLHLLKK